MTERSEEKLAELVALVENRDDVFLDEEGLERLGIGWVKIAATAKDSNA